MNLLRFSFVLCNVLISITPSLAVTEDPTDEIPPPIPTLDPTALSTESTTPSPTLPTPSPTLPSPTLPTPSPTLPTPSPTLPTPSPTLPTPSPTLPTPSPTLYPTTTPSPTQYPTLYPTTTPSPTQYPTQYPTPSSTPSPTPSPQAQTDPIIIKMEFDLEFANEIDDAEKRTAITAIKNVVAKEAGIEANKVEVVIREKKGGQRRLLGFTYQVEVTIRATENEKAQNIVSSSEQFVSDIAEATKAKVTLTAKPRIYDTATAPKRDITLSLGINYDKPLGDNDIAKEMNRIKAAAVQDTGISEDKVEVSITGSNGEYTVVITYRDVSDVQIKSANVASKIRGGNEKIESISEPVVEIVNPSDDDSFAGIRKDTVWKLILVMFAVVIYMLGTYKMILHLRTNQTNDSEVEKEDVALGKFQA